MTRKELEQALADWSLNARKPKPNGYRRSHATVTPEEFGKEAATHLYELAAKRKAKAQRAVTRRAA